MREEWGDAEVTKRTLGAWRTRLVKLRDEERQRSLTVTAEPGRLLEIVGQALAQGGGSLPADDIARIEELTQIDATYRDVDRERELAEPRAAGERQPPARG